MINFVNKLKHIKLSIFALSFLSISLICVSGSYAGRTDIVILENGDYITGDVKRLEYAKLRLKTDAMDNVYINWEDIVYIKTTENFRVEMQDGRFLFGIVHTDTSNNMLIVGTDTLRGTVEPGRVVGIVPIKEGFWQILDISADLGFSYTKASDIGQLSFSADFNHRTFTYQRRLKFSSILTSEKEKKATQNHNYEFTVTRLLRKNWFLNWATGAQKNTELDLALRLSLGMTGGKKIIHNNLNDLNTSFGLQGTKEWAISTKGMVNNLEGVVALSYRRFRYITPKQDINITLNLYPNFTTWGRYRMDFETKIKWEIITDLFLSLTVIDNFDNKVKAEQGSDNDYSVSISIGWTK